MLALGRPGTGAADNSLETRVEAGVPSPWLVGMLALLVAGAWFALLLLPGPVKYSAWVLAPMGLDLVLLGSLVCLVRRWSGAGPGWTDVHRLALAAGPLPISMMWGVVYVTAGKPSARISEVVSCALAVVLVALFARRLHRMTWRSWIRVRRRPTLFRRRGEETRSP